MKSICLRVKEWKDVVSITNTAVDPSTVSAPSCLDGLEVRVDSRITVRSADVMVVVFDSITVCVFSNNSIRLIEAGFTVNA